jgi:hypothetical protein
VAGVPLAETGVTVLWAKTSAARQSASGTTKANFFMKSLMDKKTWYLWIDDRASTRSM